MMIPAFSLTDRAVLVTGAGGFLGRYFCEALASAGATVIAAGLAEEQPQQLQLAAKLAKQYGVRILSVVLDVTDRESVRAAFDRAAESVDRVDVVVNSAAIDPKFDREAAKNEQQFECYPEALLQQSVDVNLLGYVRVAQEAVMRMCRGGGGVLVNVSSMYGLVGPDQSIYPEGTQKPVDYAITKGGVNMLTRYLATTYARDGIRANTLTLSGVYKGHAPQFLERYARHSPMGRMLKPEEVGPPLVFLAADASSGMTGANLVVDTGWTAW